MTYGAFNPPPPGFTSPLAAEVKLGKEPKPGKEASKKSTKVRK